MIVDFEIERGVDLGTEMEAEVAIGTLLGGQYLRLNGDVGPDAEGRHLADLPVDERRIPLERTQVPFTIIEALSTATNAIEELDVDAVNGAVRALADLTTRDAAGDQRARPEPQRSSPAPSPSATSTSAAS